MSDVKELQEYMQQEQVDTRPQWVGTPPAKCDLCGRKIEKNGYFVDGRVRHHTSWACMGSCCFGSGKGVGLGTGRGQMYAPAADGTYRKVGG